MASRTQVFLVDDLDGSEATDTVTFGLDGVTYEIDLNSEHADKLRQGLKVWVEAGRRQTGRRASRGRTQSSDETARIRAWAREQGLDVSDRGRIPAPLREAYLAAH
ncbi:MAG: Lsr2 family protein [Bifidobacteriaceae bacterium]|jgi:hypothetical protein|nr:Lsr2 family protein [Bifidobacteriaceae bacterium]